MILAGTSTDKVVTDSATDTTSTLQRLFFNLEDNAGRTPTPEGSFRIGRSCKRVDDAAV